MSFAAPSAIQQSHSTIPNTLSSEELQKLISSLTEEKIQEIAATMAAYFIDSLQIDQAPLRDQFMAEILPLLRKQIKDAFSTPATFYEQGITFTVYVAKGNEHEKEGLINQFNARVFDRYGQAILDKCPARMFIKLKETLKLYWDISSKDELDFQSGGLFAWPN